jgi:hypothetical protein
MGHAVLREKFKAKLHVPYQANFKQNCMSHGISSKIYTNLKQELIYRLVGKE